MEKTLMSRQHKNRSILPAASTNVLHVAFANLKNKWFRSALLGIFFIVISSAALAADPADAPRQYHAPRKGRFLWERGRPGAHKNRRRQAGQDARAPGRARTPSVTATPCHLPRRGRLNSGPLFEGAVTK